MRFIAIIPYIVATLAIILASLPHHGGGGGALAHPLGEELASAQSFDAVTGRTLTRFAVFNGRAILGSRDVVCDCCNTHGANEDYCCGENIYSCTCDCCTGCSADEAEGVLMKLAANKQRADALAKKNNKKKDERTAAVVKKDGAHDHAAVGASRAVDDAAAIAEKDAATAAFDLRDGDAGQSSHEHDTRGEKEIGMADALGQRATGQLEQQTPAAAAMFD